jgi:hypothetical protein
VAYNFLELVNIKTCAYFEVMGPLSQIKFLGEDFNTWGFTSVLFFMIIVTASNCWSRCLTCIGLPQYGFDEDYSDSQTEQGRIIVNKARLAIKDKINNKPSKSPASGTGG